MKNRRRHPAAPIGQGGRCSDRVCRGGFVKPFGRNADGTPLGHLYQSKPLADGDTEFVIANTPDFELEVERGFLRAFQNAVYGDIICQKSG